jgi:uncharacterized OB-fold protein
MTSPTLHSPYDRPMWESIAAREMRLQRCDACTQFRYPPAPVCPRCLCTGSTWLPISGRGELLSWAVFHRQYLPAFPPPYVVVAIRLDEGPLLVSNAPIDQRDALSVGCRMRMDYVHHPDGYTSHRFLPDPSA